MIGNFTGRRLPSKTVLNDREIRRGFSDAPRPE